MDALCGKSIAIIVNGPRRVVAAIACVVLLAARVGGQSAAATDSPTDARFEVATIKRNVTGNFATSPPVLPNGETRLVNVPARNLVLQAYPVTPPIEMIGAPSWLESEQYDVTAKGKAGATAAERQEMWRSLLAERMKLAAHYEMREKPTYDLVVARSDRVLGAGLKPSTLDCTQPQPAPQPPRPGGDMRGFGLSRCHSFAIDRDDTMYSGGVEMTTLVRMIGATAGRPIVDRTGLTGFFSVSLRYQRFQQRADAAPSPDDPPSLFTALQEQLGLKLESAKGQVQVLVIDHIERPEPD